MRGDTLLLCTRQALRRVARGGPLAFAAAWEGEQRDWLTATRANLRRGGRAALMVGDGEAGVDALASTATIANSNPDPNFNPNPTPTLNPNPNQASTATIAEAVGLRLLASATIASTVHSRGARHKGKRRPEHTLLLEAV